MNIFIITSKENLRVFKDKLAKKYPTMNIQGTNDLLEGIETVTSKHVMEDYDLFLILNQKFVEEDLRHQQRISSKFNEGCAYILKSLPIYFMVKEGNKILREELQKNLKGNNIKLYPYKDLTLSVIEEVIKEVLVHNETQKKDMSSVRKDVLNARRKKLQSQKTDSAIERIFEERRKDTDEDFAIIEKVYNTVNKFRNPEIIESLRVDTDKSTQILAELKSSVFNDTKLLESSPIGEIKIKNLNSDVLSEKISPKRLQEDLMNSNQSYVDYSSYMETLKDIIEKVKASDEPNKHELINDLLQEKSKTNTELYKIMTSFVTEIAKSSIDYVSDEYSKDINELHEFGSMENVDTLIGGEMASIEELKLRREEMKGQVKLMIQGMSSSAQIVQSTLTATGNLYIQDHNKIESEIKKHASENNLMLNQNKTPDVNLVIDQLKTNYTEIKQVTQGLINSAQKTIHHMVELLATDEKIIEKQDGVIDTLMTQKTKKIITVDNLLQTKLCAVFGPNGVGKTHTAMNLAFSQSKIRKTLLLDLNIYNPNLVYYNNVEDENRQNRIWLNNQTISLEEFIHIAIGKYMYEQLPYKDNLTIIQPMDVVDLDEYETIVNPSVFSLHVKHFLTELAQFYDKIIIILPENLEMFGDLVDFVGVLYMVNDFDPSNARRLKQLMNEYQSTLDKIPVKNLIINKENRGVKVQTKDYLEACNIDTREYKYFSIPEFKSSIQDKIDGRIPSEINVNVRKVFNELVKH